MKKHFYLIPLMALLSVITFSACDRGSGQNGKIIRNAVTDQVLYFISGSYPEHDAVQYVTAGGSFRQIAVPEQLRIRQSRFGLLYQLPEDERILFAALALDPGVYR